MKKLSSLILAVLMVSRIAVAIEGFTVDMPMMEVIDSYEILNVGKLAVGEAGLVSLYGLRMCIDNSELKVASISELDTSPSEYASVFEVTRTPNDTVTVVFSNKGKTPDSDTVRRALLGVVGASDCEEFTKEDIPLLSVTSFLGANSVTKLVSQANMTADKRSGGPSLEGERSRVANILTDWIVSESKSPIDDSPIVTMIKFAEAGDQTLVLRCQEDTSEAYIKTEDFLGDDSTNVMVRYDSNDAQNQKFFLSTDSRALFFSPAITNIKKMMESKKLVIRYHTFNGTPNIVTFEMSNLDEKISSLRAACHW